MRFMMLVTVLAFGGFGFTQGYKKKLDSFKKPAESVLKKELSKEAFNVTQKDGTERAFSNPMHKSKTPGIYVDVVSGEPLFSSLDKFDSKTGWPSFTKPLYERYIELDTDFKLIYPRSEVRSKLADSHLGHVFDDGPEPTGKRYCINAAALRFVPAADLVKEGYGEFVGLFPESHSVKPIMDVALFAGGCFWCSEADFEKVKGVKEVVSGYIGGDEKDANYKLVSAGKTKHYEGVKVTFDPAVISYKQLVDFFWHTIDPTDDGGQFCDRGTQYKPAVFYQDATQKLAADKSRIEMIRSKPFKDKVVAPVLYTGEFFPAEDYHQDFYKKPKNKPRYYSYRKGCKRDQRLKELWGDKAGKQG